MAAPCRWGASNDQTGYWPCDPMHQRRFTSRPRGFVGQIKPVSALGVTGVIVALCEDWRPNFWKNRWLRFEKSRGAKPYPVPRWFRHQSKAEPNLVTWISVDSSCSLDIVSATWAGVSYLLQAHGEQTVGRATPKQEQGLWVTEVQLTRRALSFYLSVRR